jgi:hypothetical protein
MPNDLAKRPVGRPPTVQAQALAYEKTARQIQAAVRGALGTIAERYPDLLDKAFEIALGGDRSMLKFLIELPTRFMPEMADEDSPFAKLVERVTLSRTRTAILPQAPDEEQA